ncbi:VaFE repeat-containing surface-anchored protein, partial [Microbacterium halotolerans]|uniref:VaFE repeat-containing surface-anchored protein n=1 Tax=Microbacterium halotolerans TaxID=246613 RepID=UPI001968F8A2
MREKRTKKVAASAAAIAVAATGAIVGFAAPAAAEDGANGEVRGYLWPGSDGTPNWEGTYRMPDGTEAWCASIWAPEPIYADSYGNPVPLTKNDGSPLSDDEMQTLAYVVSTASDAVINQVGKDADDHSAAASVIIHNMTNSAPASYDPQWPLDAFDANEDPIGSGQQTTEVHGVYDALLADAALYGGEWEFTYDDVGDWTVGDTVEVTGRLQTTAGTPIPDRELEIAGTYGFDVPVETVTTGADGGFTIEGTITDTSAMVEPALIAPAQTVMMREPASWSSAQRPQNMILVDDALLRGTLLFSAQEPGEPTIGTSAHDQTDGDRVLPSEGGTIVDVVSYENLTPGTEYTLTGELMDSATGEGTGITGEATFTPETPNGT